MLDFITDFSLMAADKPKLFRCFPCADVSLDGLDDRSARANINSIGGQVCAIITDNEYEAHDITNMAFGSRKETLAEQLLHHAFGA